MKSKALLSCMFCYIPEKAGCFAKPFVLLLVRIVWGVQFFQTGLGKLNNIERTVEFFTKLGIPAAAFHAYLVSSLECAGGLLLVAGFASRLLAAPLAVAMAVAVATAHRADFLGTAEAPVAGFDIVTKFFETPPAPFLVAALIVFAFGPGLFSVDAVLCRIFGKCEGCDSAGACAGKPNA